MVGFYEYVRNIEIHDRERERVEGWQASTSFWSHTSRLGGSTRLAQGVPE